MKKYFLTFLFLTLFNYEGIAQIVITEVYYDTPYKELMDFESGGSNHHLGEYIELYNYSNEDIPLKGWAITDYVSKFIFPDDAIIRANDFIIVAYKRDSSISNYFTTFFPTTIGKESQIYYQSSIVLRNLGEIMKLYMGKIRGTEIRNFKIQELSWYDSFPNDNQHDVIGSQNPSNFDFYLQSIHLASNGLFVSGTASPLSAEYVPTSQNLETIPNVINALDQNYSIITWEENSNALLFNTCPQLINLVEQSTSDIYMDAGKCFTYDNSGNTTSINDCIPSDNSGVNPANEYTPEEIAIIDSKIILYPNPASSVVTASWDASINGKIIEIQVASANGFNVLNLPVNADDSYSSLNIYNQSAGIYIVKFILNTGQFISKNIIKI